MSSDKFDQILRDLEKDGPLATLPGYTEMMFAESDPKQWFCVYRQLYYRNNGKLVRREFGGRNMRCYHDLGTVRHVARKWMPAVPDAAAYIFEVFPLEGEPPIGTRPHASEAAVAEDRPVIATTRRWRWTKPGVRTRLVLIDVLRHPPEKVVQLTEELIGRRSFEERWAGSRRSALDPSL